jgi:uncharacterized membrane protein
MFEEFLGLPLHPLAVHAPVVLVPLLVAVALVYALVPKVRRYVGWAALLLAIGAPVSVALARSSGQAYEQRMYGAYRAPAVVEHAAAGDRLLWSSLGLGLATLALLWVGRRSAADTHQWRGYAVTALVVILAGAAAFYVFQAGHSGAEMTHGGR